MRMTYYNFGETRKRLLWFQQKQLVAVVMQMEKLVMCWYAFQKEKQLFDLRRAEQRRRAIGEVHFRINIS